MPGKAIRSMGWDALNQHEMAIKYHQMALNIKREIKDRSGEGGILHNLGSVYFQLGQYDRVIEYSQKALAIHMEVKNHSWNGNTLNGLMLVWKEQSRYPLAIFYGKQSVNVVQETREHIRKLGKELQSSYFDVYKNRYRNLSYLLIQKGRLSEARQVLDMLKEQEFFEFIRKDRSSADKLSTQVDFTEFEKQWLQKYNTIIEKLSTISNEYRLLKLKRNKTVTEKRQLKELELELPKAQKSYEEFLTQLKEAFDKHEKEMKKRPDTTSVAKKASRLQYTLKYLDEKEGGRHAALHYLVYKGKISVILTTPASQMVKQCESTEKNFNLFVMNYRNFMMKAERGVQPQKKQPDNEENIYKKIKLCQQCFYEFIFKAVDEELKKYGATNLMVSLDGGLRYIPLAALWDGENYLLQRYRIAIITPSSLKNIKNKPAKEKKILGLGASQGGNGFAPLPYVRREIRSIVQDEENGYYGLIKGKAFIDDDFTKDTMVKQLKSKKYPLVHISSHFKFSPGDETKNHLLLGETGPL